MPGSWVTLPKWTPPGVQKSVMWLAQYDHHPDDADVLTRLTTDERMKTVWNELTKRDQKTGQYLHQAKPPREQYQDDQEAAQQDLMGETFWFAFDAARQKRIVKTQAELIKIRRKWWRKRPT